MRFRALMGVAAVLGASSVSGGAFGQYDVANGVLRYVNAGHSPVIYCPAGGPAQMLRADNVPLGVFRQSTFIEQELHLGVGDLLVVATDGLVEAVDPTAAPLGYTRLLQFIEQTRGQPVQFIANELFKTVDYFTGNRLDDDQTLFVMRVRDSAD